jgi:lysophospholipase L1-like esterase
VFRVFVGGVERRTMNVVLVGRGASDVVVAGGTVVDVVVVVGADVVVVVNTGCNDTLGPPPGVAPEVEPFAGTKLLGELRLSTE